MAEARLQLGGFRQRTDQTRQQNNYKDSSLYNYPANWATLGDLAQWATTLHVRIGERPRLNAGRNAAGTDMSDG